MDETAKAACARHAIETPAGLLDLVELMEGLDVGVVVQGRDTEILYANELALGLLGRAKTQVVGVSSYDGAWDVVRRDGRPFPAAERPAATVLATGRPAKDVVMGIMRSNGKRSWILVNAVPRFVGGGDGGEVSHVVVTLSDISSERRRMGLLQQVKDELEIAVEQRTDELAQGMHQLELEVAERRRVELALARSESMYRSVLKAMAEGVAIHAPDGAIEYANPAALRVLGLSEDQIAGRVAIDPRWGLVRPDGTALPSDEIPSEITRATGKPCSRHLLGVTVPEGGTTWLEVSTEPVSVVSSDQAVASNPPRVVATFTDVTAQRRATIALERSRARFKRVTEAVPGVLYQMRRRLPDQLEVSFVSARSTELLGLDPEQAIGDARRITERVHPDDLPRFRETFRAACEAFAEWECDFRVRRSDGTWRWVRNRGVPERDGEDITWSGVILDVNEERSLADQVQVAQRREAIGAVTAGIAHNFNNALAVLVPNLEESLSEAPTALREPLADSLRTARSAAALVRQLMLIARGGLVDQQGEFFDVVSVTHDVLALCRGIFQSRVDVLEHVSLASARVRGNDAAFHQVLLNMCLNARDALHGRSGGRVEVFVDVEFRDGRDAAATLVLRVRDNGEGMSPAQVVRLGEPFFTTKAPGVGTGLGLATAYATIRDMGGEIRCESSVGEGTEFFIELPLEDHALASKEEVVASNSGSVDLVASTKVAGSRARLLLIDDEPMVRDAMQRMLERRGYKVDGASSGAEGLALVTDAPGRYAAVVLDLSMPGMPGERVLAQLTDEHPRLPVVVLSGFIENQDDVAAARAVLNKPVSGNQIVTTLDGILEDVGGP